MKAHTGVCDRPYIAPGPKITVVRLQVQLYLYKMYNSYTFQHPNMLTCHHNTATSASFTVDNWLDL